MTDAELAFRLVRPSDWSAIWPIFAAVVGSGDTYPYPPDIEEADAHSLWMSDDQVGRRTYVAVLAGEIVATAYIKPNLPGLGDHVANAGWMVAPDAAGRGIGRRFAEFVLDEARRLGFSGMQFNAVVATNKRAIGLWRSLGFETVGTVPDAFRHATDGSVAIHVMYRRLVEPETSA